MAHAGRFRLEVDFGIEVVGSVEFQVAGWKPPVVGRITVESSASVSTFILAPVRRSHCSGRYVSTSHLGRSHPMSKHGYKEPGAFGW